MPISTHSAPTSYPTFQLTPSYISPCPTSHPTLHLTPTYTACVTEEPGLYEAVVPVVINEQWATPYQMLYISGQLQEPKVWFDPPGICMTPVPLLTDIHCEFNVLASQYQT